MLTIIENESGDGDGTFGAAAILVMCYFIKHYTGKGRSGGSGSGGSGLAGVTFAVAVGNYSAGIIVPTI